MHKRKKLESILERLYALHKQMTENVDKNLSKSEKNLCRYIAMRKTDLDELQEDLIAIGLNSLGHSQSFILSAVENEINTIEKLLDRPLSEFDGNAISYFEAKELHKKNSQMFGKRLEKDFKTRVMVTMPTSAAKDDSFIRALIENKTSIVRINTAHDSPNEWAQMAKHVKNYNEANGTDIKIYVDLAGPKNRTGSLKKSIKPLKISQNAKVRLTYDNAVQTSCEQGIYQAVLKVDKPFYYEALDAKYIEIDNPQKRKRVVFKLSKEDDILYFIADTKLTIMPHSQAVVFNKKQKHWSNILDIAPSIDEVRVCEGDSLLLTKTPIVGQSNYVYNDTTFHAAISCTNEAVFAYVKEGDTIYIDDGKIGCKVTKVHEIGVACEVILSKPNGTKLKEEKGINFVDTQLQIDAITDEDKKNIQECIGFADMFGVSFAQSANDIKTLQDILLKNGREDIAVIAKLETKLAVKNIYEITQALLRCKHKGVMIARGDLAIEVGFENMAFIQEEIFDICEAAHLPVIYATQILEGKMKKNLPSRAEITDAANAQRADCVMLNKGPYVIQTLKTLKDILRQMHKIYQKNRVILKHLDI
jgi:pyruvate kinase